METKSLVKGLAAAVAVQLAIFVVSLPGFGIETRKPSDYAAWAGPIFLGLTVLVFLLGIAALVLVWSRRPTAASIGAGQAFAAIATNLLDISHVGGPAPPPGPLALGALSLIVGVVTLGFAYMIGRTMMAAPAKPAS